MGHFLEVAQKVLLEIDRPISAREIVRIGLKKGLLTTYGKTPDQTMKSKLSTDILIKGESSIFMRTSKGEFGLRAWIDREQLYIANRFEKKPLEEDIIVFPAKSLHKYVQGRGLHEVTLDKTRLLISECYPMRRIKAEKDYSVIQLVSAFVIKFHNSYLTYKRTKRLPEDRLHHWYSVVFGGHLRFEDTMPFFQVFDPQESYFSIIRELSEELLLPKDQMPDIVYKGLLYDDSRDLSRQHLGVVYDVHLKSKKYEIGERGFLTDHRFETLSQIRNRINDFENWSVLIMDLETRR